MQARSRARLIVVLLVGFALGGLAGAGVGLGWYGPVVGVGLAVLVGLGVGSQVFPAVRGAIRGADRDS
jgi:hypothetical protein